MAPPLLVKVTGQCGESQLHQGLPAWGWSLPSWLPAQAPCCFPGLFVDPVYGIWMVPASLHLPGRGETIFGASHGAPESQIPEAADVEGQGGPSAVQSWRAEVCAGAGTKPAPTTPLRLWPGPALPWMRKEGVPSFRVPGSWKGERPLRAGSVAHPLFM